MVLLTVYYCIATGVQSWRLRSIYQKIGRVLENNASIVFLKNDGATAALASSDLCVNMAEATVGDCFWSNDCSQGISVSPKQKLFLNPFVSFAHQAGLIPFNFTSKDVEEASSKDDIYVLIETEVIPIFNHPFPPLEIEAFGTLVAWKVDTRLAVLLKTDARNFSQLILNTFLQNNYLVNDYLTVMRIQTVNVEGTPQCFEEILSHSRKDETSLEKNINSIEDWERHLDVLKNFSVLASQASEFEYKKNLTEGKTGIVQPDLISSKNIEESLLNVVTSPDTPKKKLLLLEKTDVKIKGLKVELKRQELLKSPINPSTAFPKSPLDGSAQEKVVTPESPKFPTVAAAKSPTPSLRSKILSEPLSPKFPTGSPAKLPAHIPAFSIDIDKPSVVKMEAKIVKSEAKQKTSNHQTASANFIQSEKKEERKLDQCPTKPKPLNLPPMATNEPQENVQLSTSKSTHSIRRKKQKLVLAKPPNILVYSDSITTRSNVIKTLGSILQKNTYTIYPLTDQQVRSRVWLDNTELLVVCGSVGSDVGVIFLDYFFNGGKILCLCSDLLRHVLPTYHTAEVREHELVQFTYGKWKNIKMMHHIFCYQPSPVRKHFSQESDEPPKERPPSGENPSLELKDQYGVAHNIRVQTLGTEDTWKTPSLLMVYTDNGGKIVFSQIHLEVDPSLYESDDDKYQILMKNEGLRHEIFGDVLSSHLGLSVDLAKSNEGFSKGFFLGRHELKFEVLNQLKPLMEAPNTLKLDGLTITFCGKNQDPPTPDEHCLPIMINLCPDDFSTLDYFDSLKTEHVGRLLIYSKVLVSSMVLVNKVKYVHGFAVIPKELTIASGRGNNQWLSPPGCLMFSLQLHIPLSSPLGQKISLIQHLVATSVVVAIHKLPGYEVLDIKLKWPNDIYANSDKKIGGLIVTSLIEGDMAICNIGLGVNLSNSLPTTCINDMIKAYNKKNLKCLPLLSFEKTLAIIFNEIELILNQVQTGDLEYLYNLYYKYWMHSGSSVTVISTSNQEKSAKVLGIDDYGFLKIQIDDTKKVESVQPDGNSFDMLRGLILTKS